MLGQQFENLILFQEVFDKSPLRRKKYLPGFSEIFCLGLLPDFEVPTFPTSDFDNQAFLGFKCWLKLPRQTFIVQKHLGLVGELLHYCNPLLHLIIIIHCHLLATLSFCIQVQVQMTDHNHHPNQKVSNSSPKRWGIVAKSIASDNFAE